MIDQMDPHLSDLHMNVLMAHSFTYDRAATWLRPYLL
jgi:hypothetical protein